MWGEGLQNHIIPHSATEAVSRAAVEAARKGIVPRGRGRFPDESLKSAEELVRGLGGPLFAGSGLGDSREIMWLVVEIQGKAGGKIEELVERGGGA